MEMLLPYLKAFAVGGAFCALGQVFIDYTKLTPARILVAYVVAGVILGGLGIYQPIIDFAGAGATVPLSGFGALLAKGTREALGEKGPGWIRKSCGRSCWAPSPGALPLPPQVSPPLSFSASSPPSSSAPGINPDFPPSQKKGQAPLEPVPFCFTYLVP